MRDLLGRVRQAREAVARADNLQSRVQDLEEQLAALKSSIEVPRDLHAEFAEWRRAPLPGRPLVSVLVATYNRADLLTGRCIPSVLGQTYDNLELIVIGDGCTDHTEEAVAAIDDPRLRFENLPRRGDYPAEERRRWMVAGGVPTNEALRRAGGDFVAHLDDDDEYLPDRLRVLVDFATEHACDIVWHPFWWQQADGGWRLEEAERFAWGQVTNLSVLYRSWFKRFESEPDSHLLLEPGDWHRFRRMQHVAEVVMRYPEPLARHYQERGARPPAGSA